MTTSSPSEEIHDPVTGYWLTFERDGEPLVRQPVVHRLFPLVRGRR